MANRDDLERFREKWEKEIREEKDRQYLGNSSKYNDGCRSSNRAKHDHLDEEVASNVSKIIQHGNEICLERHISTDQNVKISRPACDRENTTHNTEQGSAYRQGGRISESDSDSPVRDEPQEGREEQLESCSNLDDHSYFPFVITRRLLSEEEFCLRKKGSDSITQGSFKRKYFDECDSLHKCTKFKKETLKSQASSQKESVCAKERYLDLFIADLDEITEIPFFDISLPREVALKIFQYLDIKDLCRCAQISRSWRHLAEDELLWCKICHRLGYEQSSMASKLDNWKAVVHYYVERKQNLITNWKGRIGNLSHLEYTPGGILSAVDSFEDTVVAGYSNCQLRWWNLEDGTGCTFNPSSTALLLDEAGEGGTLENRVISVHTSTDFTAAAYTHGFVDVWHNQVGTDPVYTCQSHSQIQSLQLARTHPSLAVSFGFKAQIHGTADQTDFSLLEQIDLNEKITLLKWFEHKTANNSDSAVPLLALATSNAVRFHRLGCRQEDLTEIHNLYGSPIVCMDMRTDPDQLAVAYTNFMGNNKVSVYDICINKLVTVLQNHTANVTCMNLQDSPAHLIVTGNGDRKVRVFDLRVGSADRTYPVMTFVGHSARVSAVQLDDWKVVSGDDGGFVCVWDQRMTTQLWEWHNSLPVRYCHFHDSRLLVANFPYHFNIPAQRYNDDDMFPRRRIRGSIQVYDFLADKTREDIPEICLSSYDQPEAYDYNIRLAMPYDSI